MEFRVLFVFRAGVVFSEQEFGFSLEIPEVFFRRKQDNRQKWCFNSPACAGRRRWFAAQVLIKIGNEKIKWGHAVLVLRSAELSK